MNWKEVDPKTTPRAELLRVKTADGDIYIARYVVAPVGEPAESRVWLDQEGRLIDRVTHWAELGPPPA